MLTCKSHTVGWEIYLGNDYPLGSSTEAVVVRLVANTGLTVQSGRILYTDNWYTSINLSRTIFDKYNWLFFGTSAPIEKKTWKEFDIPFLK